jgi:hypothetical protein
MSVAIVILIIALCGIGITLYMQKKNIKYPPVIANCPDYWDVSGNLCINSMNLGNSQCHAPMNFTTAQWSGNSSMCKKKQWANSCDMTWDGISDRVDICDSDYGSGDSNRNWNSSGTVGSDMSSST